MRHTRRMPTILISGASSGLGAEMARQFAARGHDLALCARRTQRLEVLRAEIGAAHPDRRVEIRALDVNDHDAVFEVFRAFRADFGTLDRVVVNAGLGKGAPLGTGRFDANRETAMTNFVAALAQTEAAMEIFRDQEAGHLVMVSSMSAMRGMPKTLTTYAATKIGVAHLAEGLRSELYGTPLAKKIKIDRALPRLHRLGDEREGRPVDTDDDLHREGRPLDGLRDREAGRRRLRARAALGAAVRGDEARPAAGPQAPDVAPKY